MKKHLMIVVVSLFLLATLAGIGLAQGARQGEPITLEAKIGYADNRGGYYLETVRPPSVVYIANQDPKLLEDLRKNGKPVTIDGHLTIGADFLFIEKIDGKPYWASHVTK